MNLLIREKNAWTLGCCCCCWSSNTVAPRFMQRGGWSCIQQSHGGPCLCQIKRTREYISLVSLRAADSLTSAPGLHLELYPFCQVSQQPCFLKTMCLLSQTKDGGRTVFFVWVNVTSVEFHDVGFLLYTSSWLWVCVSAYNHKVRLHARK